MKKYFDRHFNKDIITIYPGEFWSSTGPELISTVLGSCVSITLFDPIAVIGGMNHFMLAKDSSNTAADSGKLLSKFGDYAMSLLIEDMEKKGAKLSRCTAKVFGGSNIFNVPTASATNIGFANIEFAFDFLQKNKIQIVSSDTGGKAPRKIYFDPVTSKVYLKHIATYNEQEGEMQKSKEQQYIEYLASLNLAAKRQ